MTPLEQLLVQCLVHQQSPLIFESASGIAEGGRSGLTAFVVGLFFIVSLFLSPIFLLIPSAATSGALVLVGVLMIDSVQKLNSMMFLKLSQHS